MANAQTGEACASDGDSQSIRDLEWRLRREKRFQRSTTAVMVAGVFGSIIGVFATAVAVRDGMKPQPTPPETVSLLKQRAVEAQLSPQFDKAVSDFANVIRLEPNPQPSVIVNDAQISFDLVKAAADVQKGIELDQASRKSNSAISACFFAVVTLSSMLLGGYMLQNFVRRRGYIADLESEVQESRQPAPPAAPAL